MYQLTNFADGKRPRRLRSAVHDAGAGMSFVLSLTMAVCVGGREYRFRASERQCWWWRSVCCVASRTTCPATPMLLAWTELGRGGRHRCPSGLAPCSSRRISQHARRSTPSRLWTRASSCAVPTTSDSALCRDEHQGVAARLPPHCAWWSPASSVLIVEAPRTAIVGLQVGASSIG